MRILLDCDGVLSDFIGAALDIVGFVTGKRFEPEQVTEFDFCKSLGLSRDEAIAVKHAIGDHIELARYLDVLPGATEGVKRLEGLAEVYIVTSPWNSNKTWCHDREHWLHKRFGIRHSHVIHTSAKHLVVGDMLVDDKTDTCISWRDAHPRGLAVRWDTPHNRNDDWDGERTCDWEHLFRLARAHRDLSLCRNTPADYPSAHQFDTGGES